MADTEKAPEILESPDVEDVDSSYKPPPEKTIEEILAADKEDESLRKYKEALLGDAKSGAVIFGKCVMLMIAVVSPVSHLMNALLISFDWTRS